MLLSPDPANAKFSILVTLSGNLICFRLSQSSNALAPMLVTLSGILTSFRYKLPFIISTGISVIPRSNTAFLIPLPSKTPFPFQP